MTKDQRLQARPPPLDPLKTPSRPPPEVENTGVVSEGVRVSKGHEAVRVPRRKFGGELNSAAASSLNKGLIG
eukprot:2752592-Pyramimonas_sp.AAC.1